MEIKKKKPKPKTKSNFVQLCKMQSHAGDKISSYFLQNTPQQKSEDGPMLVFNYEQLKYIQTHTRNEPQLIQMYLSFSFPPKSKDFSPVLT